MGTENIVVHKDPNWHSAFPDIIRLGNGDLVVVFRQAPVHPGTGIKGDPHETLVHHHEDPYSRLVIVRSIDDGKTWGLPTVIDASDGTYDLNLAVVSEVSSGDLVVNSMRMFQDHAHDSAQKLIGERFITPESRYHQNRGIFDSMYLLRSGDNGHTWDEPVPFGVPSLAYWSHTGKKGVVQLPDGTWLLIFSGRHQSDATGGAYLLRSRDQGQTWSQPSLVAYDPEQRMGFGEPALVRLSTGRLLTMMRTGGYLYQALSDDDGWTWQGVKQSPIWGYPAHLTQMHSGRVLCTYGYRRSPFGIRACVSDDQGETWDTTKEFVLRHDGLHVDLGYPASVQLTDDRLLTIYYFHDRDGIRYIGSTIYAELCG